MDMVHNGYDGYDWLDGAHALAPPTPDLPRLPRGVQYVYGILVARRFSWRVYSASLSHFGRFLQILELFALTSLLFCTICDAMHFLNNMQQHIETKSLLNNNDSFFVYLLYILFLTLRQNINPVDKLF